MKFIHLKFSKALGYYWKLVFYEKIGQEDENRRKEKGGGGCRRSDQ